MGDDNFQYQWLIKDYVQLVTIKHNLTLNAVLAHDRRTVQLMDALSGPLHMIVDVLEIHSSPTLNEGLNLNSLRHPHLGRLLTVGAGRNRTSHAFLEQIGLTSRISYRDFETVNDAIIFLECYEPALKIRMAM